MKIDVEKNGYVMGMQRYYTRSKLEKPQSFEMELVELFGVIAPTLRAAIRAIYKSGTLCPITTQRCDVITPASWAIFYNLEVIIALAFRLNTYEAGIIREKVLEELSHQNEKNDSLFIWLGEKYMGN